MKTVTKLMINEFKINKLKYDFMGFKVDRAESLTFHHLIVPHRDCHKYGLGEGYVRWNGAILGSTPHQYLHVIEQKSYDTFCHITSEMIDMNIKGYLDPENLAQIDLLLQQFEAEHEHDTTKKGKQLIKREYIEGRINWANRQK